MLLTYILQIVVAIKSQTMKHLSMFLDLKRPGAEPLLSLEALDLTADIPVECLHTILLIVTKYGLQVAFENFLNESHNLAIERICRGYKSKAFSRGLYSSLKYHKSFLDRDFKIIVQVLPSVLDITLRTVRVCHF